MATYKVRDPSGNIREISGPDGASDEQIIAQAKRLFAEVPQEAPKPSALSGGGMRFLKGLKDPIDAGAQMLPRAASFVTSLGGMAPNRASQFFDSEAQRMDKSIADSETQYQDARKAAGQEGFDFARMGGNVVSSLPFGAVVPAAVKAAAPVAAASLAGRVGAGIGGGALSGAFTPVTEGDFAQEKGKQLLTSGIVGGMVPVAGAGLSRIVSPNASVNPALQQLRDAGVNPTVGQALGGMANRVEEKAMSLPIMGDAITAARRGAVEKFNKATLQKVVDPVGGKITQTGQDGIRQAGDIASKAYDEVLAKIGGIKLDRQFAQDLTQLQSMAQKLRPEFASRFEQELRDTVLRRVSPNGGMLAQFAKRADSDLGQLATRYRASGVASEQEFGQAIGQLQTLLRDQIRRSAPANAAKELDAANATYAMLTRAENAGKKAALQGSTFTPSQLMQAVREGDKSVRKRAVARGDALMQDWATAGQSVLGNVYPDSGTTGRMLLGLGALGSGAVSPAIPAGLLAGAAAYTSPAQRLGLLLAASRPQSAQGLAQGIREASPYLAAPGVMAAQGLLAP